MGVLYNYVNSLSTNKVKIFMCISLTVMLVQNKSSRSLLWPSWGPRAWHPGNVEQPAVAKYSSDGSTSEAPTGKAGDAMNKLDWSSFLR